LQFLRGVRLGRKKVGGATFSALQRLTQYINSDSYKPTGRTESDSSRLKPVRIH
jgi:hypothetical protein